MSDITAKQVRDAAKGRVNENHLASACVKRHEELTPLPTSGIDPLYWLDVSLGSSAAPVFCRRPERRFSRSR